MREVRSSYVFTSNVSRLTSKQDFQLLDQIDYFSRKLIQDRAALPGGIAVAAQDDVLITQGEPELARLAGEVLLRLSATALVVARPSLPFADLLVRRSSGHPLVPLDTE